MLSKHHKISEEGGNGPLERKKTEGLKDEGANSSDGEREEKWCKEGPEGRIILSSGKI